MQLQLEMGYIIYNQELLALLDLAKEKKFKLYFITSPINFNMPPKETCSNSTSPTLMKEHEKLEGMIKAGRTKDAFSELKKLGQNFPGNAYNYFLLGLTLKSMGKFQEARAVFEQGTLFDCYSWRATLATNNIIRKISGLHKVPLIDFDEIVNGHFGHKQLFQDEIFPLNGLYKLLVEKLAPQINHFFKD
jgi:tetratricopeptide (TPR) repeat protein